MKLGIALTFVVAFPTVAAAQYGFQLRPSPYRILSGWEQSANSRVQSVNRVTHAATPVSDSARAGGVGIRPIAHDNNVTDGVYRTQAPHY